MNLLARLEAMVSEARPLLGDFSSDAQSASGSPSTTVSWVTPAPRHCETGALTNGLGLFVQLLLALIAFSCLVAKRYCEPLHRRRTWAVWFLDTSKQIVGAGTMHAANVLLSEVLYAGDPCTWYVINFMLDSTIGLGVIFIGLRAAFHFGQWMSWNWLKYGRYGNPPNMAVWAKQCAIYLVVIVVEKTLVFTLTLLPIWKRLLKYAVDWTTNANTEVVLVMFVIPLIVNAIIFWVVDNFLMQHDDSSDTPTTVISGSHSSHQLALSTTLRCSRWTSCCCCCPWSGGASRRSCTPRHKTTKYRRLNGSVHSRRRVKLSDGNESSETEVEVAGADSRGCDARAAGRPKCDGSRGGSNCGYEAADAGDSADPAALLLLPPTVSACETQV